MTREQLQALHDLLILQAGSLILATIAFLLAVGAVIAVALNARRTALALFGVISALTWLIPVPATRVGSPLMFLAAVAGLTGIWLQGRRAKFALARPEQ